MPDTPQYLTLGLDREHFGIDIRHVREILDMRPISKLPHAPDFMLGMIDLRGTGYPLAFVAPVLAPMKRHYGRDFASCLLR